MEQDPEGVEEDTVEDEGEDRLEVLDKVQVVIVYVQTVGIENHINLVYPVILENARNVGHQ